MKKIRFLLLFAVILLSATTMRAQSTASGTVVDGSTNEPIIGASVVVKGSAKGGVTDLDGHFDISVPEGSTLTVSYLGYLSQDVQARQNMRVVLQEDNQTLDDVVVIGYGVQKKSVVTAAISKITSDDLKKIDPVRIDNMLRGLAAGVSITTTDGQPGSSSKLTIRGSSSVNNSDPLFVVDGFPMNGGYDHIDPNDIASVEVLKDAASCAVYGTRGANGVVLITTKSGAIGKPQVSYDFSYGWQSAWRQRKLLDATQYATVMNWAQDFPDSQYITVPHFDDPNSLGKGTDWQAATFNNGAAVTNHSINISGGTDKVNYFLALNYMSQDGIVGGNYDKSHYQRFGLRSNTTYTLWDESKNRNWLKDMKLNVNVNYTRTDKRGINAGSVTGSPLGDALLLPPTMPIYAPEGTDYSNLPGMVGDPIYDKLTGKLLSIPDGPLFHEIGNPLADLSLPGINKSGADDVYGVFTADLGIWDNLRFKTTFSGHLAFWEDNSFGTIYYLNQNAVSNQSSVTDQMYRNYTWQLENVLSYSKIFGEHSIDVMLGQSAYSETGNNIWARRFDLVNYDPSHAYNLNFATGLPADGKRDNSGGQTDPYTLASYFGRVSYNYAERYMAQVTLRRDGSSLFGPNNKWAIFPSVSAGWNITNEPFLKTRPNWWTNAKLRLSWGRNGNDMSLRDHRFVYSANVQLGNNYILGGPGYESIINGSKPSGTANADFRWEQVEQYDIGLDLGFFNNALTFTADYYIKNTIDMLAEIPTPTYLGESKPWGNVGTMRNSGIELEAKYKYSSKDFNFGVSVNAAYNKNEVTDLGLPTGGYPKDNAFQIGDVTRVDNGFAYPYFYGYKTAGIFQNQAQVDAYVNDRGEKIQPSAIPGDVIFQDLNDDGTIDDKDRTNLGNGYPAWNFGLTLNATYKDFDFSMLFAGVLGGKIVDATRRLDLDAVNLPVEFIDSWHGEGTSNFLPRFTGIWDDGNMNWKRFSDLYISDGSFARIKNIQLGYTLPEALTKNIFIQRLRIYVACDNLLTLTSYKGLDPEIQHGTANGIDSGYYPQARTFIVGLNVNF